MASVELGGSAGLLRRTAFALLLAGLVGYLGFWSIELLLPPFIPAQLVEEQLRIHRAPRLQEEPKTPRLLELGEGAVSAQIPNFDLIESADTKSRLSNLEPGTMVSVLRPDRRTEWLSPSHVVEVKVGRVTVLSKEDSLKAHRRGLGSSRTVALCLLRSLGVRSCNPTSAQPRGMLDCKT